MYLQSQTSRTDTIRLHKSTSCLLFHRKTLRQHKLPDPCHHLNCLATLRSEARTCQLLIAAEEKTSNPTPKCSLSSCLSCFPLTTSFTKISQNNSDLLLLQLPLLLSTSVSVLFSPPKLASAPTYLPSNRCWLPPDASSSSHSSPRSLPSIPHQ